MFRPNPLPPPFVPPTPSYDTTTTIRLNPFPFESGRDILFELPRLNVPDYSYFKIFQFDPDSSVYEHVSDDILGTVSQGVSGNFSAERDSFDNNDFEIRFYLDSFSPIWTIKATATN